MTKIYKHCYGSCFITIVSLLTFLFIKYICRNNIATGLLFCLLLCLTIFIIFKYIHISLIIGIILGLSLSFFIEKNQNKKLVCLGQNTTISSLTGIILGDSSIYNNQHITQIKILKSHTHKTTSSAQGILSIIIPKDHNNFFRGMIVKISFAKQKILPTTKYLRITHIETQNKFSNVLWEIRSKIIFTSRQFLIKHFSNSADLFFALIFGDRSFLSPLQTDQIQKAGLVHLLALSGLHINIVFVILFKLLSPLKSRITPWIVYIFLLCYVFITGNQYPLMRAFTLLIIHFFLKKSFHNARPLDILGLVCIISLIIHPLAIFSAAWQLTFLSVLGMIILKKTYYMKLSCLPKFLRNGLSISLAIMTTTAPCLIKHFGATYPQGIITTMIILPMIAILLALGLMSILIFLIGIVLPLEFIPVLMSHSILLFKNYHQILWTFIKLFSWIPNFNSFYSLIIWSLFIPVIFHVDFRRFLVHIILDINLRRFHIHAQEPDRLQFYKVHSQIYAESKYCTKKIFGSKFSY